MLLFNFNAVEMFAHNGHPARVTHQKDFMGQLIWSQVKMINGTSGIDDEFTFFYALHFY
jgi:hypothetical protein